MPKSISQGESAEQVRIHFNNARIAYRRGQYDHMREHLFDVLNHLRVFPKVNPADTDTVAERLMDGRMDEAFSLVSLLVCHSQVFEEAQR